MTEMVLIKGTLWRIDLDKKQLVNTETNRVRKLVSVDEIDHFRSIVRHS